MPAKRRPLDRAALPRITDEVVALYQRCRDIDMGDLEGEDRQRYLADFHRLNGLLGLAPWQEHPTNIEGDAPPDWMTAHPHRVERWWDGYRLKQAIEAAVAARRP